MKKVFVFMVLAVMLVVACAALAEDEEFRWSDPGKYLAAALAPVKEIRGEAEALAYAEELWPLISSEPLPEGAREIDVDHQDESYHFSISDENGAALYCANFLSNGVIQQIGYYETDAEWASEGVRKDGDTLSADAWEQAESQLIPQIDKIAPGVLELVRPMSVDMIIEAEGRQYLIIYAEPLDAETETGINVIAVLYDDGTCRLMDYSCYGAG